MLTVSSPVCEIMIKIFITMAQVAVSKSLILLSCTINQSKYLFPAAHIVSILYYGII